MPALWPHQLDAATAAVTHLASSERCLLVMACGTGKTRAGAEATRRLAPGGKVLVVVPTQELLAQTARDYAAFLGAGAGRIGAICAERAATTATDEARGATTRPSSGPARAGSARSARSGPRPPPPTRPAAIWPA
jgi:superfamily II DNA or RNA helicase